MFVGQDQFKCSAHFIAEEEETAEVHIYMMENSTAECEKLITKPLLDDDHDASAGKGGFRTMPFILGNIFLFFSFLFSNVEKGGFED